MLSLWNNGTPAGLFCLTEKSRQTYRKPNFEIGTLSSCLCAAGAIRIFPKHGSEVANLIEELRDCDDYCRYIPGLITPKEHLDMGVLADQRKWHEKQNRWMFWATIIGGIVGGALSFLGGLVGGIVAYLVAK
jgi:hypothetical protein